MKIREIYYGKSYSKLLIFPWISVISENRKITEKIVEKSQIHDYHFLISPQTSSKGIGLSREQPPLGG